MTSWIADIIEELKPYVAWFGVFMAFLFCYWAGDVVFDAIGELSIDDGAPRVGRRGGVILFVILAIPKAAVGFLILVTLAAPGIATWLIVKSRKPEVAEFDAAVRPGLKARRRVRRDAGRQRNRSRSREVRESLRSTVKRLSYSSAAS